MQFLSGQTLFALGDFKKKNILFLFLLGFISCLLRFEKHRTNLLKNLII